MLFNDVAALQSSIEHRFLRNRIAQMHPACRQTLMSQTSLRSRPEALSRALEPADENLTLNLAKGLVSPSPFSFLDQSCCFSSPAAAVAVEPCTIADLPASRWSENKNAGRTSHEREARTGL